MSPIDRKAFRVIAGVLVIYGLLVGFHEGEFWPFSIYPMFSQAGHPWTRALVRDLPETPPPEDLWQVTDFEGMPGEPLALVPRGLWQNDLANFVSKTKVWDRARIDGLRTMLGTGDLRQRTLLVMKMQGRLDGDDVTITATPFMLLTPDSVAFNPNLPLDVRP